MLKQSRPPNSSHCLVMLDIDRFKAVNDTYGHVMGDRVLQAVGEVLRAQVSDPAHAVARYGGEEFAILMPRTSLDAAAAMARSCRDRVRKLRIRDRRSQSVVMAVTISAGVAAAQEGYDATTLIGSADGALYAAKQSGRDRVERA